MAEQNLKINITGDSTKLRNALSSASSQLSAFGSKMQGVGRSMSTSLTLPLVAAGTAATKLALDFDKSMTQIESLVGVAAKDVADFGVTAKKMALDTGRSANEAAEALFFITSAGLRSTEATDTLNASLKAAAIGLGETKTIADLATSAMNGYANEGLTATEATDILVASVREGKLEASELAGAMGGVIPLASSMGVGFNEVGAALAAMSRTGTNAANGATQLNAILMSLQKPTDQSVQMLSTLGLTFEDLEKSVAEDGLMGTLTGLQDRIKGTGIRMKDLFPNVRAVKGILDLTGSGVETNKQIFESLNNTLGATDEAFKKTSKSASFQFAQGMQQMKTSLMEIGQQILPIVVEAVQKLSGFIKGLTDKFKGLSPETQSLILTLTGILGAAGPLLILFGKLMTGISALGPILTIAATGFRVLTMAMAANPIIAIASAIALVVAALNNYTKAQNEATKASVEKMDSKAIDDRLEALQKELALFDERDKQRGFAIAAEKKKRKIYGEEIELLKARKKALEEAAAAEAAAADAKTKQPTFVLPEVEVPKQDEPKQRAKVSAIGGGLESAGIATPITDAIKADTEGIPNAISEQMSVLSEQQQIAMENAMIFNQGLSDVITGGLNQLAEGIGGALGQAISGGGNLAQNLSKVVLGTIGGMAMQLGKLAISIGLAVEGIKKALQSLNPAVAVAAGIALIALGSFAKSKASSIGKGGGGATAFANGGIVSGPTMGLVGEYPGARQNPEVIAPLNKLNSMMGGKNDNVNVSGNVRLEGQDLLIAFERANETADRIY